MRIKETGFSANVALPCRIFIGTDRSVAYSGIAMNIDTGRLSLNLGSLHGAWQPAVGEDVWLELPMPVNVESAKAKLLSVRAKVAAMEQQPDGTKHLELTFRKPSFKDRRTDAKGPAVPKAATNGWEM
jgi:hypothetical protein